MMTAIEPTIHADMLSFVHNKLPVQLGMRVDDATIKNAGADLRLGVR